MAPGRRLLVFTRDRAGASFRERIGAYLPALAERGIACDVVELAAQPLARFRQWRRAWGFDGVLLHRKTLTAWDAWALRGSARRLIYDFDDAVMFQARAAESGPHRGRLRRFRRTVAMANLVIAGSPVLAGHAAEAGAAAQVIPTGLDATRYQPKQRYALRGGPRLVWIGSRSTLKQLAPFQDMFTALGQALPELVLRVIADAELHVPGLSVENVPWSLETQGQLLTECDVGIAPLPDTSYTRGKCGYKVLQYMAAGLPVIASPVGANADYVAHGKSGLWARTTDEWLAAVSRLVGDEFLRRMMGLAGRRRVATEFDQRVLGLRFCSLVENALR